METGKKAATEPATGEPFDLGSWVGRAQAFSLVANRCSATEAECLRRIRESRAFQTLGMNWDQFCERYVGVNRTSADRLIQKLDEFGEIYFQLSRVTQVSAESFRLIASKISDQGIEIDGETVALTPENGPRIRQAVKAMRKQLREALAHAPQFHSVADIRVRLDACFGEMKRISTYRHDAGSLAALRGLIGYTRTHLATLERSLPFAEPED